jgi:hypothetical protein
MQPQGQGLLFTRLLRYSYDCRLNQQKNMPTNSATKGLVHCRRRNTRNRSGSRTVGTGKSGERRLKATTEGAHEFIRNLSGNKDRWGEAKFASPFIFLKGYS